MLTRLVVVFTVVITVAVSPLALAGGPQYRTQCAPAQAPAPCGPAMGYPPSPYWGDAPLPGLCGGVIALPFLVVGSLLGGNPAGPYGPHPGAPAPNCPPPTCAPAACPPGGPQYGPQYGPPPAGYRYGPPAYPMSAVPGFDMLAGFLGG